VLVGDGRRWFIPGSAVEGTSTLNLGGRKYSEFEIEPGAPIIPLVYGARDDGEVTPSRIEAPAQGERRRGRVGLDCKSSASLLSGFESLLPHSPPPGVELKGERALGRSGQAIIREKRQMTLPAKPFSEAGLQIGDRLRFRADGDGRVVIERIEDTQPELAAVLTEICPNGGPR
jgi:hypothetical protein